MEIKSAIISEVKKFDEFKMLSDADIGRILFRSIYSLRLMPKGAKVLSKIFTPYEFECKGFISRKLIGLDALKFPYYYRPGKCIILFSYEDAVVAGVAGIDHFLEMEFKYRK